MSNGTKTGPAKTKPYEELSAEEVEKVLAKYADMIAQMQTPEAMAAVDSLFTASPEEIGAAASRQFRSQKAKS